MCYILHYFYLFKIGLLPYSSLLYNIIFPLTDFQRLSLGLQLNNKANLYYNSSIKKIIYKILITYNIVTLFSSYQTENAKTVLLSSDK